jgi:hypothetical protein
MKLPGQQPQNRKLGEPPSRNFIAVAIWQGLAFLQALGDKFNSAQA